MSRANDEMTGKEALIALATLAVVLLLLGIVCSLLDVKALN
jgi:hypothetical protein